MTTQRAISDRSGPAVHPPKVEVFDLPARTNTDPKRQVRRVHEYRRTPFGLYVARSMPGHPRLAGLRSWLLPDLGLRVTRWAWHPGHERDLDFYLDVVGIETGDIRWRSTDYYLDIEVRHRSDAQVLDYDEFVLAVQSGLLSTETAQRALHVACTTVDGLARYDYDLPRWLHDQGIELSWPEQPTGDPASRKPLIPPAR
ncbi:DUF402 domain-containing protein [Bounagaea algeriensis]